mgnify:CR=1 FL=1
MLDKRILKAEEVLKKEKENVNKEYRLGYHIMAPANWINDPNGLIQYKGEYLGIREMRKHVAWYTKGLPGSAKLREEINRVESYAELEDLLKLLSMTQDFGTVLRAKGIVQTEEGGWLEFDMVPEETEIRDCKPDYIGRICVIGTELKKDELEKVFAK